MRPSTAPAATSTRAVDRALQLLTAVATDPGGCTLTQLARATELSPSTASRLLATLAGHAFVRRGDDGRFRPGQRLKQLAAATLRQEPLYELAGPHLEALAQETGETANLGVALGDDRVLYLRQVSGRRLVHTATWTGRTIPRAGTALGAALDDELGPGGYAATRTTVEPDVTAVAAPVRDHDGAIVGALSVIAPTYRTSEQDVAAYGLALVRHAEALSSPPPTPRRTG